MENTLVNSLLDSNKDMTDDYLLVRGAWHHPNQWCPTGEGTPGQAFGRKCSLNVFL